MSIKCTIRQKEEKVGFFFPKVWIGRQPLSEYWWYFRTYRVWKHVWEKALIRFLLTLTRKKKQDKADDGLEKPPPPLLYTRMAQFSYFYLFNPGIRLWTTILCHLLEKNWIHPKTFSRKKLFPGKKIYPIKITRIAKCAIAQKNHIDSLITNRKTKWKKNLFWLNAFSKCSN